MATAIKKDIDLGITRLEYGDANRPQRAVLTIETHKFYNGGLISSASVSWHGRDSRCQLLGLGGTDGDYGKRLSVSARTVKATQKNIDTQHAQVFTDECVADLVKYAKEHYASAIAAGVDGFKNTYLDTRTRAEQEADWQTCTGRKMPPPSGIECPKCDGCGFHSHQGANGYEERTLCRKCNGAGEISAPVQDQVADAIIRETEAESDMERSRR